MTNMMYPLFLIVCVFFATALAAPVTPDPYAEDMENRKKIALDCIDQVNIDVKIIVKAMSNPYPDDLPTDSKYKEFLTCSYKKQKFQSENGEMLYDNIKDFLIRFYPKDQLTVLDRCRHITAQNDADMAFTSLKCVLKCLHAIESTER